MRNARFVLLPVLAVAGWLPVSGQAVVSTHSGLVYFFEGSVFIADQPLEQKFGKFPEIGEGRELRTQHGRAEILLTPGVFLRIGENSSMRMMSSKLVDTQVELLSGSAILEANEARADNTVTLSHKNWQVRLPQNGVYRIDSDPAQLQVYKGKVEVSSNDNTALVAVKEGETLPFAEVLLPEKTVAAANDPFKNWAMSRSQTIVADNNTAANIVDDPSKLDNGSLDGIGLDPTIAGSGLTYFPPPGISPLGLSSPYGISFWSPYQATLSSVYFSPYMYGVLYPGWPNPGRYFSGTTVIRGGIPSRAGSGFYSGGIIVPRSSTPYIPPVRSTPIGVGGSRVGVPPPAVRGVSPAPAPHVGITPHAGGAHAAGHR
ncbi:MAG: FecR domain-containing protein [Bryobacterales bacterium]|nr:FecR domain-containing protein [Bryobacterales bacterium]